MRATAHEVHIANDGTEGLALVERLVPDVLFTDVAMPGLSGYQLADAIRARPHLAHIPIVLITASEPRLQREDAYRHGAVGILAKPFGLAELRAVVEESLRSRHDPAADPDHAITAWATFVHLDH